MKRRSFLPVLAMVLTVMASRTNAHEPKPATSGAGRTKNELSPKLVTLQAEKIALRDALQQLTKQTGIQVEDRRRPENAAETPNLMLKLDLKGVTFWQALDAIAKEADLRVGLYQRSGVIALVEGPHLRMPVCYDGIFRISMRRVTAVHDLESDLRFCVASLEIAWEPRFHPLFLESKPQNLVVTDDKQESLRTEDEPAGKVPVQGKLATTLDLHLPAPARKAAALGALKGSVIMVGSPKMLEFEFDTLAKEKTAKDPKQTKDDVTVRLKRLDLAADHWTIQVGLDYPDQGPKFESFQSWVVNNECFLKKAEGEGIFPNKDGYSVDSLGSSKAALSYHFLDGRYRKTVDGKVIDMKLVRGKPEDWKLVYRTPGPMAEVTVTFAFKDVPLP